MRIRSFFLFFRESLESIRYNPVMSLASVVTIIITLFISGVFAIIVLNVNNLAGAIESNVEIQVFFDGKASMDQREQLEDTLTKMPGIDSYGFVSSDMGLESIADRLSETPTSLLTSLGGVNPLPDSYVIRLVKADDVVPTAVALQELPIIQEVQYGKGIVEKLFQVLTWVRYFGVGLIVFLAFASIIIVAFNIKMTVASHKTEIQIMKYVGASKAYIRGPFAITGMILGVLGAVIAVALIHLVYGAILASFGDILVFTKLVGPSKELWILYGAMLGSGLILGSIGSLISLNVYLKEDIK